MINIIPFKYMGEKEVRIIDQNGEHWWVAKDVCDILGLINVSQAMDRLDTDERSMFNIGRQGETNVVNESGLYSLILRSNKPEAKQFKKWITHEVLPTIHKTGAYMTPETVENAMGDPDFMIGLLEKLKLAKVERDKAILAEQEAIRTKSFIGDKKTATAMATASAANRKLKALEQQYGVASHCAVKGITWLHQYFQKNGKFFPYSLIGSDLAQISDKQGYEIKKAPDEKYREVNSYHVEVIEIFKDLVKRGEIRPALQKYLKELPI